MEKLRKFENVHLLLWLAKDLSWVMDWKILGMLMIVPTVSLAIWFCWKTWNEKSELAFNLAVAAWIMANGIWMTGEFYLEDGTRPIAMWFFLAGLFFILRYYLRLYIANRKARLENQP
ncbi:MAG: hypothetical protein EP332_10135 [Bacteroidetes bacterium]|nr:MAG: hypothetical protein EP332_10135 [Bacteroidota bacterium]